MGDNLKVKWTAASVSIDIHAEGDDLFARRMFLFCVNGRDTVRQRSPYFTLLNLQPGEYAIDVAYVSSDERQTSWSRALTIKVQAPWYRSHAFNIGLNLAIALTLVFFSVRWNYNIRKDMEKELSLIKRKSEDETFMLRLNHCVLLSIEDPDMDINLICRELGVSHTALFKRVKQITGASIKEYIDGVRLERAKELVKFSALSFRIHIVTLLQHVLQKEDRHDTIRMSNVRDERTDRQSKINRTQGLDCGQ